MGAAAVRQAALLEVGGGGGGGGGGGHNNMYSRAAGGVSTNRGDGGGGGCLRYSKSAGVPGVATPSMGAARLPPMNGGGEGSNDAEGEERGTGGGGAVGGSPMLVPLRAIASAPSAVHASLQLPPSSLNRTSFGAANDPLLLRNSTPASFMHLATSPTPSSFLGSGGKS
jgi:hypothetical protein